MGWALAVVFLVVLLLVYYIKKVPDGFVEIRSGLLLKFAPGLDNKPIPVLRKALELAIAARKKEKRIPVRMVKGFELPTRHGPIEARYYTNNFQNHDRAVFYIHGGGWSVCSIDTHDEPCRHLAIKTGISVISINYSLAPEAKFPQALEECIDALQHLLSKDVESWITVSNFVICGDSAGGNLAIGVIRHFLSLNQSTGIEGSVLIYPATDLRVERSRSYHQFSSGYYLTDSVMSEFAKSYLSPDSDLSDPRISPLAVHDWKGFPPTLILTAEFDPLRDEGEEFGKLLWDSDCHVEVIRYASSIHGFFGFADFGSNGIKAIDDVADFIDNL